MFAIQPLKQVYYVFEQSSLQTLLQLNHMFKLPMQFQVCSASFMIQTSLPGSNARFWNSLRTLQTTALFRIRPSSWLEQHLFEIILVLLRSSRSGLCAPFLVWALCIPLSVAPMPPFTVGSLWLLCCTDCPADGSSTPVSQHWAMIFFFFGVVPYLCRKGEPLEHVLSPAVLQYPQLLCRRHWMSSNNAWQAMSGFVVFDCTTVW